MKRTLVSLAVLGVAGIMLGACAYDPYYDGPYDGYYGPPRGAYGPPPPANYPPPGYDQPPAQGYAPQQLSARHVARMNDPNWCNAHPQRCAYFHSIADGQPQGYGPPPGYNGQDQGPPPGYNDREQGPPPQGYGPPPGYEQQNGPPPNYGPPPGGDEANGPPQQMQQPQ